MLEKVILSVHSSEKLEAESVIEAYSFSFTYVGDKCSDNVEVLLEKTQRMEIDAEQSPTVDNKGKEVCSPSYEKAFVASCRRILERERLSACAHQIQSCLLLSTSVMLSAHAYFIFPSFRFRQENCLKKAKLEVVGAFARPSCNWHFSIFNMKKS